MAAPQCNLGQLSYRQYPEPAGLEVVVPAAGEKCAGVRRLGKAHTEARQQAA